MNQLFSQGQSATVLRLLLELTRTLSAGLLREDRFAANADDLLLMCAVYVGQVEGKPMTAAKLAAYAGMARPTAIRKLGELQARGLVQPLDRRRYALTLKAMGTPEARRAVQAAARRVVAAAGALEG